MKIGFVFTNFNNSLFTKTAINSINNINIETVKIIIVDNASNIYNREILEDIKKQYKNVDIVHIDKNIGYFPGLNRGLDFIHKTYPEYDYVVIGNNDLIFPPNFLHNLKLKKDLFLKYPVISPNILTPNGVHQNPHVIKSISKCRELLYDLYHCHYYFANIIIKLSNLTRLISDRKDEQFHTMGQEIYQGYGACYILGPLFFKYFNELWAPTFLLYEEFFLSKQLSDKGFKIYYEPSICLTHVVHATTSCLPNKQKWLYSRKSHKEYRKYVKIFTNPKT